MNSAFVSILNQLISEQGKEALLNAAKCKAFLADYTKGEYKKESRLLLQALDAEVAKAIDDTKELEICKQQQARVLQEEHFLAAEAVADVVDTLALVLRGGQETSQVCANCGKELQKEWLSCPYCGTPAGRRGQAANYVITSCSEGGYGTSLIVSAENSSTQTVYEQGKKYFESADYDSAIEKFTEAIRLDPSDATMYCNRGAVYFRKRQDDITIRDCTEAIRLNPNIDYFYYLRGEAYLSKDEYDMAIRDFTETNRLNPNNAWAYLKRASIYLKQGNYDAAFRELTEVSKLSPDTPDYIEAYYERALFERALFYERQCNYDAAIRDFTEVIRLDPDKYLSYFSRGKCYQALGQKNQAIQDFEKALSIDPLCFVASDALKELVPTYKLTKEQIIGKACLIATAITLPLCILIILLAESLGFDNIIALPVFIVCYTFLYVTFYKRLKRNITK